MRRSIRLIAAAFLLGPPSAQAQEARPTVKSAPYQMTIPEAPLTPSAVPPLSSGLFGTICQTGAGFCRVASPAPVPPGTVCSCGAEAGQTQ